MPAFRALILILSAFACFHAGASLVRAETWRMVGSFGGWDVADAAWTLEPHGDPASRHVIERRLAPGRFMFRFVREGSEESEWLGASAGDPWMLERSGDPIPLVVRGSGRYRITLDLSQMRWILVPVEVDETLFDARLIGRPVAGRSVVLDLSRTLTVGRWDRGKVWLHAEGGEIARVEVLDRDGRVRRLSLGAPGPMTITVSLSDGGKQHVKEFPLTVEPQATLRYLTRDDPQRPRTIALEPQGGGVLRALVSFEQETEILAAEVDAGGGEVVRSEGAKVPAGAYVVEVRDGSVVTQRDPTLPFILIPGNWRLATFDPKRPVERVHLLADFNGWAGPGQAGAIELMPRGDGVFAAIIDPPVGMHRYRFLIDGEHEATDPRAGESAAGPGGRAASVMRVGPGPAEYPRVQAGAINLDAVRHEPASRADVRAISRDLGLAEFGLTTLRGDAESATMEVEVVGPGGRGRRNVPMARVADYSGFDRWTARVMTGEPQAVYSFTFTDGGAKATTRMYSASIEPANEPPAWALGAVWYEIVPERFRNGNPLNDPRGPGVFLMNWTDDWEAVGAEEERAWRDRHGVAAGDPWPPRRGGPLYHVAWNRRYGGDLQGVAEKFEYLRELGVTAVCLAPVFEADSIVGHDVKDYRHIDENLGRPASAGPVAADASPPEESLDPGTWKWTPADRYFVDEFLPGAKRRGLRVVLDCALAYTGREFFAFRDIEARGAASEFRDWYAVEFDERGRMVGWESWRNNKTLPMFRRTPDGDLAPGVREYLFGITRRWMDPNGDGDPSDGIDGWRVSAAGEIGRAFWLDWRALVKGLNPGAVIIGDEWDQGATRARPEWFDARLDRRFASATTDWLGVRPAMTARALEARLMQVLEATPSAALARQTALGRHDTDRLVSMLMNPNRAFDRRNRPQDEGVSYREARPHQDDARTAMLGVALQALYEGSPVVFQGDEVGMWGADDPSNLKPFPWDDLPGGPMKNADERADWGIQKKYARLMSLRQDPKIGPVLRFGATRQIDTGEPGVFAFERSLNGVRVFVVVNREDRRYNARPLLSDGAQDVAVPAIEARWWVVE